MLAGYFSKNNTHTICALYSERIVHALLLQTRLGLINCVKLSQFSWPFNIQRPTLSSVVGFTPYVSVTWTGVLQTTNLNYCYHLLVLSISCIIVLVKVHVSRNSYTTCLTPWSWIILQKLMVAQLAKKLSELYGVWWLIAMFTKAYYWG
jgi:hypothetical protein